jgi:hypothetical protein
MRHSLEHQEAKTREEKRRLWPAHPGLLTPLDKRLFGL